MQVLEFFILILTLHVGEWLWFHLSAKPKSAVKAQDLIVLVQSEVYIKN